MLTRNKNSNILFGDTKADNTAISFTSPPPITLIVKNKKPIMLNAIKPIIFSLISNTKALNKTKAITSKIVLLYISLYLISV